MRLSWTVKNAFAEIALLLSMLAAFGPCKAVQARQHNSSRNVHEQLSILRGGRCEIPVPEQ